MKLTLERLSQIIDILLASENDRALTAQEQAELIDGVTELLDAVTDRDNEIERIKAENDTLRQVNQNLMTNTGRTVTREEVVEEVAEEVVEELTDEEILNAFNEIL